MAGVLSGIGRALSTFVGTKDSLDERRKLEQRQIVQDQLAQAASDRAGRAESRLAAKDEQDTIETLLSNLSGPTDVSPEIAERIGKSVYSPFVSQREALPATAPAFVQNDGSTIAEQDLSRPAAAIAEPFMPPSVKAAIEATKRGNYAADTRLESSLATIEQRNRANAGMMDYRMQNLERLTEQGQRGLDIKGILASVAALTARNNNQNADGRLAEQIRSNIIDEAAKLYPPSQMEDILGEIDPKRKAARDAYIADELRKAGYEAPVPSAAPRGGAILPSHSAPQTGADKAAAAAARVRGR